MAVRFSQVITGKLEAYLEDKGFNKAAIARQAGIDPELFYSMLKNRKIMTADNFVAVCKQIGVTGLEIANYKGDAPPGQSA